MQRFQGKSVLVVVTTLLLLGDIFGMRSSVPKPESDVLSAESVAPVAQAAALSATPEGPGVPAFPLKPALVPEGEAIALASVRRGVPAPRLVLPPRTPSAAPQAKPARTYAFPPAAPVLPSAALLAAQAHTASAIWLGSIPLRAAQPDNALPPRKWTPPQGAAYIRWWAA